MTLPADPPPFARLRGLDGIRAIAVSAVVAFHLGWDALPGGFLGVEVFFVVSGYLITALLLHERRETGRIRIRRFWLRRGRRLLPALFVTLLGTLSVAAVAFPDEVTRLRTDALAAFAYVTNWYLIAGDQPYFETVGRPSALLHLWSLAIEEQFYLLWPLLLASALAVRGWGAALAVAVAGIAASVVVTVVLYTPGDPSRVYYGTDARAAGLLIGAFLALCYVPAPRAAAHAVAEGFERVFAEGRGGRAARRRAVTHDLGAGAGLAILVGAFVLVGETAMAFPGGLLAVDVGTALLIAAVVAPSARLVPAVLETAPLRWLGTRSYAVYLWHWPVIVFTRPGADIPLDGPANLAVRLLAIGLLSEATYRLVEQPVRRGALGRLRAELATWRSGPAWKTARLRAAGAASVSVAVVALLVNVALAAPPPPPSEVPVADVHGIVTPPPAAAPAVVPASATPGPRATRLATPRPTAQPPAPPRITAFGESVLIAAAPSVARAIGSFELDAKIGRQAAEHIEVIRARVADGTIGDVVIVAIGNNGPIWGSQAEELMVVLADVPIVLWVNVSLAREWEDHNNRLARYLARNHDNVTIVDWHTASTGRKELFAKDLVHPNARGSELYADLLRAALPSP